MMYSQEELKHCLECRWRKRQIKINLGFFGFISALFLIFGLFEVAIHLNELAKDLKMIGFDIILTLVILFVLFLCCLPSLIYYCYDYKKILKLSEEAEVYEVVLDHPSTSYGYRGAIYYAVRFQTKEKENITADTKPLWSSSTWTFPIEEYNNKKVEILYHKEEDRVIVLGLKDWNKNINLK